VKPSSISISGIRRKDHFESGGTIAGWRGRARRFEDKKKKESKNACRKGQW
jgi:hypothetical protein